MFQNVTVAAASEEKWGRLVRTWATGTSEFPSVPIAKLGLPRDLAELKAQCVLVGVDITIPPAFKGLVVIQHSSDTLALRLPSKKMVEEALAMPSGSYKIPAFYATFCGPLNLPAGQENKFQALRIGDYSIGNCQ